MERLDAVGISASELHLAGGGTADQAWRQLLADVLGKRLLAVTSPAGAARGAALLAGWSAGVYAGANELAALAPRYELVAEPGPPADEYSTLYRKYRAASGGR
jgi:xylulokinase